MSTINQKENANPRERNEKESEDYFRRLLGIFTEDYPNKKDKSSEYKKNRYSNFAKVLPTQNISELYFG